jgi:hypothetical protein
MIGCEITCQSAKYFKMAEFETFQDGGMRNSSKWQVKRSFMFAGCEMFQDYIMPNISE